LFVLGGLFIAVTLLLPRGIVGTIHYHWREWRERRRLTAPVPNAAPRPAGGAMGTRPTTAPLYLDAVTLSFDRVRALVNTPFTIEPGEMRAIIGPNGAGKTTMMDVVTGKTRPDTGEVYFDGSYDLSRLDETEIALLGIGRKFQKPTVFDMHTVEDNIGLALK